MHPHSRLTKQAEAEALRQLKDRSFSQVSEDLRISYRSLRPLLERETDDEGLGSMKEGEEILLGIDEHRFRHDIWCTP